MKKVLENIRNKPPHHQNRIILLTVVAVTLLLIIAWAIIGIPTRRNMTPNGDLIDQFGKNYNENKNTLPDLFPKN